MQAAIEVTKLTTGKAPNKNQIVFGPRALDIVFADQMPSSHPNGILGAIHGTPLDLAKLFDEKPPVR